MKLKTSLIVKYIWYLPGLDHQVAISPQAASYTRKYQFIFAFFVKRKKSILSLFSDTSTYYD